MKYIPADKLIAEIERQKKAEGWCEVGKDTADVYYARGFRFACDNLLSFVASLQKEIDEKCQTPDWLFEEIVRYQREDMDRDTTVGDVARHFYKLGISARKEERKDLIPLINRICEAILFEWKDAADLARETLTQIKEVED